MLVKNILRFLLIFLVSESISAQTLIINEFSNGPSGAQEYLEFIVVDDNAFYNCGNTTPPCVDIRGWIIDDNSGYHGAGGVASGCNRFSYDPLWQCVPLGTIIVVYNNVEPNTSLPADDLSMSDNNCRLVIPINNTQFFESNPTTPGAVACSYPSTGWTAGGIWSRIGMANSGDCARLVNLSGCEVSSVCYGDVNLNTQIYFASGGSGQDNLWFFNDNNPAIQLNWIEGCSDPAACGTNDQTPGAVNNSLNSSYVAQFNNNCLPISPLSLALFGTVSQSCTCDGSATISASGSIGPYSYTWYDQANLPIGQTTNTASNLCSGNYYCVVTSSIGCSDTITVFIGSNCSNYGTFASATMIENCVVNQFYNTTWANLPDQINPNGVLYDGYDYGPYFQNSSTLILRGGEVKTFKNPGSNVCGAKLNYTIYTVGNQPTNPVFTILDLPFKESCNIGPNNFPTGGPCFNDTDQKWAKENYNIDLTTLSPGDYVLEVYYSVPGSFTSTTACNDTIYVNNNGANYKAFFQIKPTPLITANTIELCEGQSTTLNSNYSSGNNWSSGETSQTVLVNSSGPYTLTINLNNSCPSQSDNETITIFNLPISSAGIDQVICSNSSASLSGIIGGGASSGTWSGGTGVFNPSTSDLNATYTPSSLEIASGLINLTLTSDDPSGPCPSVNDEVVISINQIPLVDAGQDLIICPGSDVNLSGIIGGGASFAIWSGGTGSYNPSSSDLSATYTPSAAEINLGSITLVLTTDDPVGPCANQADAILITFDANPVATFSIPTSFCEGAIPSSLATTSDNGINGTWSPNTINTNLIGNTDYIFTPNPTECGVGVTLTVNITPSATAIFSLLSNYCENDIAEILPSISDNGINGSWNPSIINTSVAGNFNYVFTPNSNQCAFDTTISVLVYENPIVNAGLDQIICSGENIQLSASIAGGANSVSWSGGTGVFNPNSALLSTTYTPSNLEINNSSITLTVTTDDPSGPCLAQSDQIEITINLTPNPPVVFSDTTYCENAIPISMLAIGNGIISWYSDLTLNNLITTGSTLTPNLNNGNSIYYITQSENGCQSLPNTIQINIELCEVIIPTAFTPDDDNVNDFWQINNLDSYYPQNKVYIYNRWGNNIFESQQGKYESNPWDGKFEGKDMPVGSYYFIIEYNDDNTSNSTGIVSIIK
jgi:gliding motility-associated-like protein